MAQQAHHEHDKKADHAQHDPAPAQPEHEVQAATSFTGHGAVPAVAGHADAATTASEQAGYDSNVDKRKAELTAKHGVRPRDYTDALDGSNTAELILREAMPQITQWLNNKAAGMHLDTRFTVAELTTNFLAEGGILALKANAITDLDGFQVAGVDTFMDRYAELKPWLHPSIEKDKVAGVKAQNEKGEQVTSIGNLTLVQAAWANATMYAAGKTRLEKWLKRHNNDIDNLSSTQQFYWATTYYNAGEGYAEKKLAAEGVKAADKKWTKADDWEKYYTSATYNAKMRSSTFELTRDEAMHDDKFKPITPEAQAVVAAEASAELDWLRAEIAQTKDPKRHAQLEQQMKILESAQQHQLTHKAAKPEKHDPHEQTPAAKPDKGKQDEANGGGGW